MQNPYSTFIYIYLRIRAHVRIYAICFKNSLRVSSPRISRSRSRSFRRLSFHDHLHSFRVPRFVSLRSLVSPWCGRCAGWRIDTSVCSSSPFIANRRLEPLRHSTERTRRIHISRRAKPIDAFHTALTSAISLFLRRSLTRLSHGTLFSKIFSRETADEVKNLVSFFYFLIHTLLQNTIRNVASEIGKFFAKNTLMYNGITKFCTTLHHIAQDGPTQ